MAPKTPKTIIDEAAAAADFVFTITSRTARRRAGIAFGPSPVHLTREQLEAKLEDGRAVIEAIEADTALVVRAYKPEPQGETEAPKE